MADEQTPPGSETQTGGTPTGETPTTPATGETPGTTATQSLDDAQKEIKRLADALKRANAEAKEHRVKASELDALKKQIEEQQLSEKERLEKRLADLQKAHDAAIAEAKETRLQSAVQVRATQLGFADPDDALRFIDRSKIEDDMGNLDALLKAVIDAKPYLKGGKAAGTQTPTVGATSPARSTATGNQPLSWELITELQKDPAAYNARNANGEISRWLQAHPFRYGQKN